MSGSNITLALSFLLPLHQQELSDIGSKDRPQVGFLEHLVPKVAKLPYYEDTTKYVATLSVM